MIIEKYIFWEVSEVSTNAENLSNRSTWKLLNLIRVNFPTNIPLLELPKGSLAEQFYAICSRKIWFVTNLQIF